jgi:hypothetical protein
MKRCLSSEPVRSLRGKFCRTWPSPSASVDLSDLSSSRRIAAATATRRQHAALERQARQVCGRGLRCCGLHCWSAYRRGLPRRLDFGARPQASSSPEYSRRRGARRIHAPGRRCSGGLVGGRPLPPRRAAVEPTPPSTAQLALASLELRRRSCSRLRRSSASARR